MAIDLVPGQMVWGIFNLLFGILVLVLPKFLRFVVGTYFLIVGLFLVLVSF